jgi:protein-S-isoprenylcysteine O-methyltransferase Ste14
VFLVMVLLLIILQPVLANAEERFCLEKYGQAYKDYMDRTPKWFGLPRKQ